jgi:hypothetical protein
MWKLGEIAWAGPSRIVGWADEMLRIDFLRCTVGNSGSTRAANNHTQIGDARLAGDVPPPLMLWSRCPIPEAGIPAVTHPP